MKVINKVEEKMFGRDTVTISIENVGVTPARSDLQKKIAEKEKADPKLVVVNEIKTITGSTTVSVTAQIYKDAKSYKLYVPAYLAKKSEVKEEPKPEPEAPAEEPAKEETSEEKPVEEVKDEEKKE